MTKAQKARERELIRDMQDHLCKSATLAEIVEGARFAIVHRSGGGDKCLTAIGLIARHLDGYIPRSYAEAEIDGILGEIISALENICQRGFSARERLAIRAVFPTPETQVAAA